MIEARSGKIPDVAPMSPTALAMGSDSPRGEPLGPGRTTSARMRMRDPGVAPWTKVVRILEPIGWFFQEKGRVGSHLEAITPSRHR